MKPGLDLRLYGVLDPALSRGRDPLELALAAVAGGMTLLQLRDKTSSTRDLVMLARSLRRALVSHGVPLVINDRVDVALAAAADGVHIGRSDMAPADARRLLGPDAILGITVHHGHEAAEIPPGIADYAGLGPVYQTRSKDPGDPPLGSDGLNRLIGEVRRHLAGLPVCGIAGIDATNAPAVIMAGSDGVAVISDVFGVDDVTAAASRLRGVIDKALAKRQA